MPDHYEPRLPDGAPDAASDSLPVPAGRARVILRARRRPPGREDLLPAARRLVEVARSGLRHPAVAASASAAVTVAAQVGLRMLEQRANGRTAAGPPLPARVLRITETHTLTVEVRQRP